MNSSNLMLLIIIIIALALCFMLMSKPCPNKSENFDIGSNYCNDFSNDVNTCLGYGGSTCNYCYDNNLCFPKYSTYNNLCNNVGAANYPPNASYLPYIYDIYASTARYFNWNEWYNTHDYFPPFIFKGGRYYLNINALPPNDPARNQYAFLAHNGVSPVNVNSLIQKRGQFTPNELTTNINNIKNLGNIGNKIITSLGHQNSQSILTTLGNGFGLSSPRTSQMSNTSPSTITTDSRTDPRADSSPTPTGVSSSASTTSMPAEISGM